MIDYVPPHTVPAPPHLQGEFIRDHRFDQTRTYYKGGEKMEALICSYSQGRVTIWHYPEEYRQYLRRTMNPKTR